MAELPADGARDLLLSEALGTAPAPGAARAEGGSVGPLGHVLYWAPVFVTLGFLAQVALLGLKPALVESRRLAAAEEVLGSRLGSEIDRGDELRRVLRAHRDPIYLERERRMLLDPRAPLATRD